MGSRPHVVLVVADDMGYSDLGCYGGEIATPALDRLGRVGVRLTRFYNTTRCSPSRASLLTGLHPHQTGIGILTNDDRPHGYPGSLNHRCVTLAEMLRRAGYATCLTGKWHLCSEVWTRSDAWPTRRGFERFFGTLSGCGSYYRPTTLTRGESNAEQEAAAPGFFYTDVITSEAEAFVRERASREGAPFFLYLAYTAPHWPLHAPADDVARYRGVFDAGWDELREARLGRPGTSGPASWTRRSSSPTWCRPCSRRRASTTRRRIRVAICCASVTIIFQRVYEPNTGLLNTFLTLMGLGAWAHPWLGDPATALPAVIAVSVWKNVGFSLVILLAGLQGLPQDVLEAAAVDGANAWQRTLRVITPLMRPILALTALLSIIGGLKVFDLVFIMTRGGPTYSTEVLATMLYREAFELNHMGIASAIGVILVAVVLSIARVQTFLLQESREGRTA